MADDKTDSARQMLRLALANLQLEIDEKRKTGSNGALDLTAATAQVFDADMTAMEEQQHLRAARQAILGNASADKAWTHLLGFQVECGSCLPHSASTAR